MVQYWDFIFLYFYYYSDR